MGRLHVQESKRALAQKDPTQPERDVHQMQRWKQKVIVIDVIVSSDARRFHFTHFYDNLQTKVDHTYPLQLRTLLYGDQCNDTVFHVVFSVTGVTVGVGRLCAALLYGEKCAIRNERVDNMNIIRVIIRRSLRRSIWRELCASQKYQSAGLNSLTQRAYRRVPASNSNSFYYPQKSLCTAAHRWRSAACRPGYNGRRDADRTQWSLAFFVEKTAVASD